MDKMQVEEMHSIFAQKITYEEKSAILQNVQNDSVGIKVNFCGRWLFQLYRFKISYSVREIGRPEILRDEHGIGNKLQKENQADFNN